MTRCIAVPLALLFGIAVSRGPQLLAQDWIAAPSTYTHDPQTRQRVSQYSPIGPVYALGRNPTQSGYRHIQNTIRAGGAADYLHVVEEWGNNPVRPYGEWQFPFRPFSAPYPYWGPPVVMGFGFPGFGAFGGNSPYWYGDGYGDGLEGKWPHFGGPGMGGPGFGGPGPGHPYPGHPYPGHSPHPGPAPGGHRPPGHPPGHGGGPP
jgi:hypothetical protein